MLSVLVFVALGGPGYAAAAIMGAHAAIPGERALSYPDQVWPQSQRFARRSEWGDTMNMDTSWTEIAAALAVMGIIAFLLLV